jgi:hypothetical protein
LGEVERAFQEEQGDDEDEVSRRAKRDEERM